MDARVYHATKYLTIKYQTKKCHSTKFHTTTSTNIKLRFSFSKMNRELINNESNYYTLFYCNYNKSLSVFSLGEGTLPWATPCLRPSRFFFKSDRLNPNIVEKNYILYCFSWKVTFSMCKVNFWMFGFIETKRLNVDSFTNEN